MRILLVVHQYPPEQVGGTELYTQTLARYLVNAGHSVTVYYPSQAEDVREAKGGDVEERVVVCPEPLGARSRSQVFRHTFGHREIRRNFKSLLHREQPEVVHIQHLMGLPVSLPDEIVEAGIPNVVTVHDYWYGCANAQLITNYDETICPGPDRYFVNCGRCAIARSGRHRLQPLAPIVAPLMAYRNRRLGQVLSRADRVIVPTQFVQTIYQKLGLPTDNIVIVPHGIELPAESIQEAIRRRRQTIDGSLHIGYVGSLARQKGIHNLVAAVNGLPAEYVRLSIYGDLTVFPEYVAELRRSASHPGINFMGRVTRDKLWSVIADFDVFVLPTLWYEASPLTIQEAFAVGVPIIASRIGAIPEKIRSGVDGLLVPPGDVPALRQALQHLQQDPSILARLRAGILPVRNIEDHVEDVVAVYRSARSGRTS